VAKVSYLEPAPTYTPIEAVPELDVLSVATLIPFERVEITKR
jgi:hypothetical protein